MADMIGMPIWYELMTPDVAGATAFYGAVVGWTVQEMPMPSESEGVAYTLLNANDGQSVGGVMPLPKRAPIGPGWLAYFHVADVDAKVAENEAGGGATHMPATTMDGVGRVAMVADAQGILFYLMTPQPPADAPADARSTSFSEILPQRCAWNELVTTDHKRALRAYASLLGWRSKEAMPMGAMGDYSFLDAGETRIGAMMDANAPDQPTRWTFYFKIPDVEAAVATVEANGGQVIMGPMEVPGGQRIIVCVDPQGASVCFVSGERQ